MIDKIKSYMANPVYGKLTVGMVVAVAGAYVLYRRYN